MIKENIFRRLLPRNIATLVTSNEVLNASHGKLSLLRNESTTDNQEDSSVSGFLQTFEIDLMENFPTVDCKTFRDHLMIPPLGWRSLLSPGNKLVKIKKDSPIPYKVYVPGSPAAHNYPLTLLPRSHSARIPNDVYVARFSEDLENYQVVDEKRVKLSLFPSIKMLGERPLLHEVIGKSAIILIFSGDLPHVDISSVMAWKNAINPDIDTLVILNRPCGLGHSWAHNRYLRAVASNLIETSSFTSISRRLSTCSIIDLHQYRRKLPSVLLVDKLGYIRWHAVGIPNRESISIMHNCYNELSKITLE